MRFPLLFRIMLKETAYSVVRDLVGHGIGAHLHEDPEIPNFRTKRKRCPTDGRYDTGHGTDGQCRCHGKLPMKMMTGRL